MTVSDPTRSDPTRSDPTRDHDVPADVDGRLYLQLRQDILDRKVVHGELLLETTVGSRYGVSRTPVRAALVRLEHDGLVERATRGYRIRTGTAEDVLEIYEARIALEGVTAAAAALRRTDLELARLQHLQAESEAAEDAVECNALHRQWHEVLWEAGHNRTIADTLVRLCAQLTLVEDAPILAREELEASSAGHREIVVAIEERDADRAGRALTDHLTRTRDIRLADFARARR
ncbi:GntR family transcriptional regulator [Nakamurella leprariae]|uniref:GntR family transcriptional regulator n=1 Tax=Nakamurella leprariae TaxID=2803911 RepID=A0A939BYJ4_9ACTN|nr:GntR family transcriptional regulator [Nakamurella leprariae]MBM9466691.1 GntR family transcriptional regulator [Nakamurella leprariae]